MMLLVSGSSPRKSIKSPKSASIMEPRDAKRLKPICVFMAQSRMAVPRAPLWDMKAIFPGSGLAFRNEAFKPNGGREDAGELGPHDPHAIGLAALPYLVFKPLPCFPGLFKSCGDDDDPCHSRLTTLRQHLRHGLCRCGYYREATRP